MLEHVDCITDMFYELHIKGACNSVYGPSYLSQTEQQEFCLCPFTFERACWMYCVRFVGVDSLFILRTTFTLLWLWMVLHFEQLSQPGARGKVQL